MQRLQYLDTHSAHGDTALHLACEADKQPDHVAECVELLLSLGADPLVMSRTTRQSPLAAALLARLQAVNQAA